MADRSNIILAASSVFDPNSLPDLIHWFVADPTEMLKPANRLQEWYDHRFPLDPANALISTTTEKYFAGTDGSGRQYVQPVTQQARAKLKGPIQTPPAGAASDFTVFVCGTIQREVFNTTRLQAYGKLIDEKVGQISGTGSAPVNETFTIPYDQQNPANPQILNKLYVAVGLNTFLFQSFLQFGPDSAGRFHQIGRTFEFLFYNRHLSLAEQNSVKAYLETKYSPIG